MCNLFSLQSSADEVARHFGVALPVAVAVPPETVRGSDGVVIRETRGRRVMQTLSWGFPRLTREMRERGEEPTRVNLTADLTNPMWSEVARDARYRCIIPLKRFGLAKKPQWRCIIPGTAFAEAEGPKGAETRTWFSVKGHALFGWGGLWRESAEWGPVYSGAMTDCNEAIRPVHDRMPVLLMPEDYERWLNGSFDDLLGFQNRCFPDDLIAMSRTAELWSRTSKAAKDQGILA